MRQLLRLAILLAAVNANATGLWINGVEQIAASGAGSVVTNVTPAFTNDFSSNPTNNGWVFVATNVYWVSASNQVVFGRESVDGPSLIYTSAVVRPSAVYTVNWEVVSVSDAGAFSAVLVLMQNQATNAILTLTNNDTTFFSTVGQKSQPITGAWDSVKWQAISGGGGAVRSWMDNIFVSGDAGGTSIATNSTVVASGGPTIDGIVPLSTNRHTFLNGVRSP